MWLGLVLASSMIAFCIRLFPIFRWEAAIHDLDPWFNFRATEFLAEHGYGAFAEWFVTKYVWHPLGRPVGSTVFPGLMISAWALQASFSSLGFPLSLKDVCVFTGPLFAAATSAVTYGVAWEVSKRKTSAVLASLFIALAPAYVSRSTAGAFDNEAIAIFALVLTLFAWLRALSSGLVTWAVAAAVAFFFMAASWGGYVLVLNIIALHVGALICTGRHSKTLSVAYTVFYVCGILLVIQIPVLGVATLSRTEWALAHAAFALSTVVGIYDVLGEGLRRRTASAILILVLCTTGAATFSLVFRNSAWLGRSLAALDPTFARRTSPMVASVAEHQPSLWATFVFDFHVILPLSMAGMYFLCEDLTNAGMLMIIYGSVSFYLSSGMVRLLVTLAPAVCILASVGVTELFDGLNLPQWLLYKGRDNTNPSSDTAMPRVQSRRPIPLLLSVAGSAGVTALIFLFSRHSMYAAREQYSGTGLVVPAVHRRGELGQRRPFFDDFREAYAWLRANTANDSRIAAWWDYGYQITGMAKRVSFADGNTWNFSHIAVLGKALVSNEKVAHATLSGLGATHALVVCGAKTGFTNDDIGKFLWPVRVAASVYSEINESLYIATDGQFRLDSAGTSAALSSALYKLCYHRFGALRTTAKQPFGYDVARGTVIGNPHIELSFFEEAFSSRNWLVRVYRLREKNELISAGSPKKKSRGQRGAGPSGAAPTTSAEAAHVTAPPGLRYAGCYRLEAAFTGDRVYNRGIVGTRLSEARAHAVASRKPFLAVARLGPSEGHAYALSAPVFGPDVPPAAGCGRPCDDVKDSVCGCAESWCGELAPEPGQVSARRWAVYELVGR